MGLNQTEKNACDRLLQEIRSDYLNDRLTANALGLTGRDLNVPKSKVEDVVHYLKNVVSYGDKIVEGESGKYHVLMYIVKKSGTIDITGHEIVYQHGKRVDKTITQGQGKAGAALFNVHVDFNGVSEAVKKQLAEYEKQAKENAKVFQAKKEAEEKKKKEAAFANPFAALDEVND